MTAGRCLPGPCLRSTHAWRGLQPGDAPGSARLLCTAARSCCTAR